jgi:SET domain
MGKVEENYQRTRPYTRSVNSPIEDSDLEKSWFYKESIKNCARFVCFTDYEISKSELSEIEYDKIKNKLLRFRNSLKKISAHNFINHVLTTCIEIECIYIDAIKSKEECCTPTIGKKQYDLWNMLLEHAISKFDLLDGVKIGNLFGALISYIGSSINFLDVIRSQGFFIVKNERVSRINSRSRFFSDETSHCLSNTEKIGIVPSISEINSNVFEDESMDQSVEYEKCESSDISDQDEEIQIDDFYRDSQAQTSEITTKKNPSQDSESECSECSESTEIYFDSDEEDILMACENKDQVKSEIILLDSLNPETIHHFDLKTPQGIERFSKYIRETRNTEFEFIPSEMDPFIEIATVPEINQLGVFATERIESGTRLGSYKGERKVTDSKTSVRGPNYYLWEIKKNLLIDGSSTANFTAFINHSPDCNVFPNIEGEEVVFYTLYPINSGEQLLYKYGNLYFENLNIKPVFLDPSDDWKSPKEKVSNHKVNLESNECVTALGFPKNAHLFPGNDGVLYAAEEISDKVYRFYPYQYQSKATKLMLACYSGDFEKVEQLVEAKPSMLSRVTLYEGRNALMYVVLGKSDLAMKIKMIQAMSKVVVNERWMEIILAPDTYGNHVIDYCLNLSDEIARKKLANVFLKISKLYDRLFDIYQERVLNLGDVLSDVSDENKKNTVSIQIKKKLEKIEKQADSLESKLKFINSKFGNTKHRRNYARSIMQLLDVFLICVEFEKNNANRINNNADRIKKLSKVIKKYNLYNLDKFGPYILRMLAVFYENLGVKQWNDMISLTESEKKMDLILDCTLNYIESCKIYHELRSKNEEFNFMSCEILDDRYLDNISELVTCLKVCDKTRESCMDVLPDESLSKLEKICNFLNTKSYVPDDSKLDQCSKELKFLQGGRQFFKLASEFFKSALEVNLTSMRFTLG